MVAVYFVLFIPDSGYISLVTFEKFSVQNLAEYKNCILNSVVWKCDTFQKYINVCPYSVCIFEDKLWQKKLNMFID